MFLYGGLALCFVYLDNTNGGHIASPNDKKGQNAGIWVMLAEYYLEFKKLQNMEGNFIFEK